MLLKHFPDLEIVYFDPTEINPVSSEIETHIKQTDLLIHSSGPGIIGREQISYWKNKTDKPLRYTPYYKIHPDLNWSEDKIKPILKRY